MAFGDHVKVRLGLDSKGFNQGLSNAQAKAKKFGSSFKGSFIGAIGTAVIARASKQIIDFGASIGDLADRVGVTSEFLQKMQFSAEQNGSSVAEANKAIMRLGKSIGDAKDGLSTAVRAFDRAGVTFKKTNGEIKSIEEVAFDLADGLKNMSDDGERVKVAFDLMGRSGLAMTQFMNGGSEAMKSFGERAEQLGFILSNDNVRALQDASGELEKLGRQIKVFGAKILPPLFEKFKNFVKFTQDAIDVLKPYGSALLQIGKALASYWATAKIIGAGQIIVGAFIAITKAVKATTIAVVGLNIASAKNPFGLLIAGAVLLLPMLEKLTGSTSAYQKQLQELRDKKISQLRDKVDELNKSTSSALDQMMNLKDAIDELTIKPIASFSDQVTQLKEVQKELKGIVKTENRRIKDKEQLLERQRESLANIQAQEKQQRGNSYLLEQIAKKESFIAETQKEIATRKLNATQSQRDLLVVTEQLTTAEKNLVNEQFARENGLEKLLETRNAETIELERAIARTKALREEGEKGLQALEREFEIQDKIKALMKNGQMTMKDATKLAGDLVDAKLEEKRVVKEIADLQQAQGKLAEQQVAEAEKKLEKLNQEKALHQANQALVDQQLQVLQLQANGQGDLANLLQARIDNERKLLDIQNAQGLNLNDAVAQLNKKLFLQAKINAQKLQEKKEEIVNNAVAVQGNRKLGDAIDREDKKRIRAGREVMRIDKRIAQLQKEGGVFADKKIEELKKRRAERLGLVLDDDAKKALDKIGKEKLEAQKEFKAQQKALDLAKAKIEKDKADIVAKAEEQKEQIQKVGDDQAKKMGAVLDAGKKGIEQATAEMVNKLKQVQMPQININQGKANAIQAKASSEATKVFVVNQLNQGTQDNILQTLKGYFVNQ